MQGVKYYIIWSQSKLTMKIYVACEGHDHLFKQIAVMWQVFARIHSAHITT